MSFFGRFDSASSFDDCFVLVFFCNADHNKAPHKTPAATCCDLRKHFVREKLREAAKEARRKSFRAWWERALRFSTIQRALYTITSVHDAHGSTWLRINRTSLISHYSRSRQQTAKPTPSRFRFSKRARVHTRWHGIFHKSQPRPKATGMENAGKRGGNM